MMHLALVRVPESLGNDVSCICFKMGLMIRFLACTCHTACLAGALWLWRLHSRHLFQDGVNLLACVAGNMSIAPHTLAHCGVGL